MRDELIEILVDPEDGGRLTREGDALTGSGTRYPIVRGVPRFAGDAVGQEQTASSFGYKWATRQGYEDDRVRRLYEVDEPPRYGVASYEEFRQIFRGRERVLDAGCGSGHYASLYLDPTFEGEWVGLDLSLGIEIAQERFAAVPRANFVQGNLLRPPLRPGSFDLVLCRGVMHHTPDTRAAFHQMASMVRPAGEFMFLIYRRNNAIREFTDDYIRGVVSSLPPDEAWAEIGTVTEFGRALANSSGTVTLEQPVPMLGIPAGTFAVHQLFYDYFLKAFYRPGWTFDESNLISFDWWHPVYAYRHTEEEIRTWCAEEGLAITHLDDRGTGFTVRAIKQR